MTNRRKQRRVGNRRTDRDGYKLPAKKHQLKENAWSSSDIPMLASAVANGWPKNHDARAAVIEVLLDIVQHDPLPANQVRAAKVIVAAASQDSILREKPSTRVDTEPAEISPTVTAPIYDPKLIRRRQLELMAQADSEPNTSKAPEPARLPGLSDWQQQFIDVAENILGSDDQSDDSAE